MDSVANVVLVGVGATAFIDAWALVRRAWLGVALPDYGLVGRWIAHAGGGRVRHRAIAAAAPVAGERALGWLAHYLIGIAFAACVPALFGVAWLRAPSLAPALLVGIGSVAAPFLVMQPAMGFGVAASKAPRPRAARLQSLVTHALFGLGLFVAALSLAFLQRQ